MTAFLRVFGLVLGLVGGAGAAVAQDCAATRTILVLHSYAPDYSWTQAQNEGIARAFTAQPCPPHVRIEYLDSKYVQTEAYFAELAQILASKYQGAQIDGVITTDNSAFDFVQRYGRGIYGAVPTVSGGLNAFNRTPPRPPVVAALPEIADHVGTLRQAYRQNPTARDVYAIVDTTVTGIAIATEIRDDMKLAKLPLSLHMLENLTLEEIETELAALPSDAIVYLVPFFRDAANQAYAEGEVARRVVAATKAPVYASWVSEVRNGVVGGRTISGLRLGEEAAQALSRWLDGAAYAVPLPVHPTHIDLYDEVALKAHRIDAALLPGDATILNRPPSLWERHHNILIPAAAVIALLAALLVATVVTLRGQRLINASNERVLAMNREVIETQREVVATLGEVIEARSLETANHVHRVAAISRFLGAQVGMSAAELDILEGASPLHDVGKIGIPEEILAKPGKLTPEEFEVIKTHTSIGQRILRNSTRTLMHAACTIAHEHHERWDGKGYPRGLEGEEIHLMARITMLADVYDALLSERCYKPAWPEPEALAFILSERGTMFDPTLVDILIDNIVEVRAIRAALADDPGSRVRFRRPPSAIAETEALA